MHSDVCEAYYTWPLVSVARSLTFPQDLLDKKEALWPWFKAQTRTWIFLQRGF